MLSTEPTRKSSREEKIFLPASPDQLGNENGRLNFEFAGQFALVISPVISVMSNNHPERHGKSYSRYRSGRDRNDIVRHNIAGTKLTWLRVSTPMP